MARKLTKINYIQILDLSQLHCDAAPRMQVLRPAEGTGRAEERPSAGDPPVLCSPPLSGGDGGGEGGGEGGVRAE